MLEPFPLGLGVGLVRHELEETPTHSGEFVGDRHQLLIEGERAGLVAVTAAVLDRAAGRHAECAGANTIGHHAGDLADLGGVDVVLVTPVAEHIGPHCGVRHGRAQIEGARHLSEGVDVFTERLPAPVDAFMQRRAGDVLDRLHQLDQERLTARANRGEADATVPHHCRGNAVVDRRTHHRVPGGLAVVVGVHVDPTGGDERPVGLDLAPSSLVNLTDGNDLVTVDRNVGGDRRCTGAVDDLPAAYHEVMHADIVAPAHPQATMAG